MRKTLYLAVSLLVLAACGCGKPQTLPIIPSGPESGTGGKETIPEPGITYATEAPHPPRTPPQTAPPRCPPLSPSIHV